MSNNETRTTRPGDKPPPVAGKSWVVTGVREGWQRKLQDRLPTKTGERAGSNDPTASAIPAATTADIPFRVITPDDVRASIKRAKRSLEKAAEEIVWQVEMEAWRTLGYRSWSAMREAEYGGAAFMVPAKLRPELVARMRANGLSQQDIADTAGVSQRTVSDDLNSNSANEQPPTITNTRGQQRPASYSSIKQQADPVAAEPTPTTVTCPTCGGTGRARAQGAASSPVMGR